MARHASLAAMAASGSLAAREMARVCRLLKAGGRGVGVDTV